MRRGKFAVACGLVVMTFLSIAIPASAQTPGSWTLDCKGNSGGATVSLQWYDNGVLLATGGGSCGATGTLSGSSAPPANANLLRVTLAVFAAGGPRFKTDEILTIPGQSFSVHLSASAHFNFEPSPNCVAFCVDFSAHEHAKFSLEG